MGGGVKNRFLFPEDATPLDDCSGLIPTWVYTLKELNRIEFENILEAKKRYFQKPIPHPEKWFQVDEKLTVFTAVEEIFSEFDLDFLNFHQAVPLFLCK